MAETGAGSLPQETAPFVAKAPEAMESEPHKFDVTVVFGQGPIKPVLLYEELTPDQQKEWTTFKDDPLKSKEPEFRVLEGTPAVNYRHFATVINQINTSDNLTPDEKNKFTAELKIMQSQMRVDWQHNPRYALHRYGRLVAIAAGAALVEGQTKDLILSGGKTMPGWAQPNGASPLSEDMRSNWPSEAELMRRQIIQIFGKRYQDKFGKDISEALHIEESSPTTIHNFAFALERYKNMFQSANSIGFLSTDVHLPRVMALAELTVDQDSTMNPVDAQKTLEERAAGRKKMLYENIVKYTHDIEENPIATERLKKEETLLKELIDPQVIAFWELSGKYNPALHESVLKVLDKGVGSGWAEKARPIFTKYGLNYDELSIEYIYKNIIQGKLTHQQYDQLKQEIKVLADSFPTQYVKEGTTVPVSKKDV